jgi:hypothetical protein
MQLNLVVENILIAFEKKTELTYSLKLIAIINI